MEKPNSLLKVCFVCSSFYPAFVYGGPTFSNYALAKRISEQGIDVQVVTTNANGDKKLDVNITQNKQETNTFSLRYFDETIIGRFSLPLLRGLKEYLQRASIVHVTDIFSTTLLITLFYTRKTNHKLVLSTRGILAKWGLQNRSLIKKIWLSLFIKPNISRLHFHATAEKERKDILALFPKAKTFVVPNGIEIIEETTINARKNQFASWLQKRGINNSNEIQRICSIGRIHHKKGLDILIQAFAKSQKQFPNTQLLIAGSDDGQLSYLKSMVDHLELKSKVWFLGQLDQENKSILLSGADLFALPSHDENFGNVYLEALNFGTPIIASKNTPWKAAEEYGCGLWINNSVEATADAMAQILSGDFIEYYQKARQLAKQFSFEKTIPEMKKNYLRISDQQSE